MSGIVDDDVHVAALRLDDVLEPVNAHVVDLLAAGIVQHLHVAGGDAQRVHEILVQHIPVIGGKVAVGQRGRVLFVGDNQGVGLAIQVLFY